MLLVAMMEIMGQKYSTMLFRHIPLPLLRFKMLNDILREPLRLPDFLPFLNPRHHATWPFLGR